MRIKTHYTRRLGILPDPKPQRGDMFIEYQATPLKPQRGDMCVVNLVISSRGRVWKLDLQAI